MYPQSTKNAPKKLVAIIKQKYPEISEKEASNILNDIKRYVKVVHKMANEPQATVQYKEQVESGKKVKNRILTTTIEEFGKIAKGEAVPLDKAFRDLAQLYEPRAKKVKKK